MKPPKALEQIADAFGFDEIPGGRPALDRARNVAKNMGAVTCLVRHPTDDPCIVESWL